MARSDRAEMGWVGSFPSSSVRDGFDVGLWKDIRGRPFISDKFGFLVNNGKRVKFWRDIWRGGAPYVILFLPGMPWLSKKRYGWWRCGFLE